MGRAPSGNGDLLVGLDDGDDAAGLRIDGTTAVISTADFFTPVVDDAYDFGPIVAANALSDVYAMGGRPVLAVNLVGWPRSVLPLELLREGLRGGLDVARSAGCAVAGGHSINDPEPKYGMAVTGLGDPNLLLRNDAAVLNDVASAAAVTGGAEAATDVTGFGLLGHLWQLLRASGVGAVLGASAVPVLDGAWESLRDGFVSGGRGATSTGCAPTWTPTSRRRSC